MTQSADCTRCGAGVEETVVHCVRDCNLPQQRWRQLGLDLPYFFQHEEFEAWQHDMLQGDYAAIFLAGTWKAWCTRNSTCLGGEDIPMHKIIREVKLLAAKIEIGVQTRKLEVETDAMGYLAPV